MLEKGSSDDEDGEGLKLEWWFLSTDELGETPQALESTITGECYSRLIVSGRLWDEGRNVGAFRMWAGSVRVM